MNKEPKVCSISLCKNKIVEYDYSLGSLRPYCKEKNIFLDSSFWLCDNYIEEKC